MNRRRWVSRALPLLIAALSQYACSGNIVTQPPQSEPAVSASPPEARPTVRATPSPSPTPAISTDPIPGWTWFHSEDYSIAYPQQWQVQSAERLAYGYWARRFVSPETGTEVAVHLLGPIGKTDWLDWLRKKEGPSELLDYPSGVVSANATFHGIPAFFFFNPGNVQWGDIVNLYFVDKGQMVHIEYRSQRPSVLLAAENAIFTQMLDTFSAGVLDGKTVFPVDWADGYTLITYLSDDQDSAPDAPFLDITGTLLDYADGGNYVIQPESGGKVHATRAMMHLFMGRAIDWPEPSPATGVSLGDVIRIFGTNTSSGGVAIQVVYRQDFTHQWRLSDYRSFFDLDKQPLPSGLLMYYPLDGSARLWLYGSSIDKIRPYLLTQPDVISRAPANLPALAYGSLREVHPPKIGLDALFVQNGPCAIITFESAIPDGKTYPAQYCYNWQQVLPVPDPLEEIGGEVLAASETDRIILLKSPQGGYVALTPAPDLAVDWSQLGPGATVQAKGKPGEAGALIVSQITVTPPRSP